MMRFLQLKVELLKLTEILDSPFETEQTHELQSRVICVNFHRFSHKLAIHMWYGSLWTMKILFIDVTLYSWA